MGSLHYLPLGLLLLGLLLWVWRAFLSSPW